MDIVQDIETMKWWLQQVVTFECKIECLRIFFNFKTLNNQILIDELELDIYDTGFV